MSGRKTKARLVPVELTIAELALLERVAVFYERNYGPFRHVVRVLSGPEMRRRFDFVAQESDILRRFAESERVALVDEGTDQGIVRFTVPALVAFWGRLLSSTRNQRARRKLSRAEIERRELLTARLRDALAHLPPPIVEAEVSSRRELEQQWMRAELKSEPAAI